MTQKKAKAADMLDGGAKDEASLILDYLRGCHVDSQESSLNCIFDCAC